MGEQSLSVNPVLYRTFYLLTPASELPPLPPALSDTGASYWPVHIYTILQIVMAIVIFIVTLTKGAPAFPVIIIALVPFRLVVMRRWWGREVLRFVDAWACREGTPEDDEDKKALVGDGEEVNEGLEGIEMGVLSPKGVGEDVKEGSNEGNGEGRARQQSV
jgi:hypothetical protein